MGMGMLFAGALTGGANAVGQLADNASSSATGKPSSNQPSWRGAVSCFLR